MSQQPALNIVLPQDLSLYNFIPGPNLEVYNQLFKLQAGHLLYLFGSSHCGKTHLLKALQHHYGGLYFDAQNWPEELSDFAPLQAEPLLAIDDIEQFNDAQQSLLFDLLNLWKRQQGSTDAFILVLAGAHSPLHMQIREDLRNRLGWDLAYRLHPLATDDMLTAIQQRAFDLGMKISDSACRWLLNHTERSIPTIYAWLRALDNYSIAQRRQITVPLIKSYMAQHQDAVPLSEGNDQ
ncbi:HdaA/DnaA family protein [Brackiella oedipodis]|uniref:HdaA/DnaA family protein n=1 Tax=Brackiella oedipodis TaxID=124225 RepID=UPI00068708C2|nr:hypothetical protein [Brackiella oedipodis]